MKCLLNEPRKKSNKLRDERRFWEGKNYEWKCFAVVVFFFENIYWMTTEQGGKNAVKLHNCLYMTLSRMYVIHENSMFFLMTQVHICENISDIETSQVEMLCFKASNNYRWREALKSETEDFAKILQMQTTLITTLKQLLSLNNRTHARFRATISYYCPALPSFFLLPHSQHMILLPLFFFFLFYWSSV